MSATTTLVRRGLAAALLASAAGAWAAPSYVDVTSSRNITFVGTYGSTFSVITDPVQAMMQRNMGNGAAVGDYDDDGDLDILLLGQLGYANQLLRNNLAESGVPDFTDVTTTAGLGDTGLSRVAHFVDLDNDGDLDVLLVNDDDGGATYSPSKVYRNNDDGTFTDMTATSSFRPVGYLRCGAALSDYDDDGLLDVYVTNWGAEIGSGSPAFPGTNRLYRNLGNFVFSDVTTSVGLGNLARDSFSSIFHDFDGDSDSDIFVAIDHTSDAYYRNDGGTFVDATATVGAVHTGNDMGVTFADFDDDGDCDVYATNITDADEIFGTTQGNALNVNQEDTQGTTLFDEQARARGADDTYWGWGVEFTDVEHDGDLDIVAVTGFDEYVEYAVGAGSSVYQTPSVLFVNDSTGNFTSDTGAGLGATDDSRGLIAFDYDRDGDEDLLVTNVNQPVRLYENVTSPSGNWLEIDFVQSAGSNRNGIGVVIRATVGATTYRRDLVAGDSYLAGTPPELHLGLGSASTIDQLEVEWTDGTQTTYSNVAVNRFVTARQGVTDADLDGAAEPGDCDAADHTVWATPSEATGLALNGASPTGLTWSAPDAPGATAFDYDVLRSTTADFSTFDCVVEDHGSESTSDGSVPSQALFYVVRVKNACGENAGLGVGGAPRTPAACP